MTPSGKTFSDLARDDSEHRERIAVISTWFPPYKGVAVNRIKAFERYLRNDFEVDVFTLGDTEETLTSQSGSVHYLTSNSFFQRAKHQSSDSWLVHTLKSGLNLFTLKFNVSKLNKWKKKAFESLMTEHRSRPYRLIISSYAPVEAHEVACLFKQNFPEVKWIADMRDEMGANPFASEHQKRILSKKEVQFAPYVDGITSVSQPILNDFKLRFPLVKHFSEVRNGYDHELEPIKGFNKRFTMVFAGTFYGKLKPDALLKVLSRLKSKGRISGDFLFQFIGGSKNFSIPRNLISNVTFIPLVPYEEAVGYMRNADCNVLICPPFEAKGRFTGKLFDYISVERPILAIIDKEDVAAYLINEHKAGFVADFHDEMEIETRLLDIYSLWSNKIEFTSDSVKNKTLHRRHQVEKMKNLIKTMLEK